MPQRNRILIGDEVEDQAGNVGIAVESRNRATGETFLSVRIFSGPKAGGWGKVWQFSPRLDWSPTERIEVCADCDRPFRGGPDPGGSIGRRIFCRSCDRETREREARQAKDARPSHAFGVRGLEAKAERAALAAAARADDDTPF